MLILGLTGGIACGKSTVSRLLRDAGAVIVDGDVLSRELTAPGGPALPAIRGLLGEAAFNEDGSLNRRAVGVMIFGDDERRAAYDGIMQPLLLALILRRMEEARESGAACCVLDMPLLYEVGLDRLCDRIWCVFAPVETQIRRLRERDGFSREEALSRIHSQLPTGEKAARADVVIDTDRPQEETARAVREAWARELDRMGGDGV